MALSLNVKTREEAAPDDIKGVVYGPKQEAISVAMDRKEFTKIFEEAGESTILTLKGLPEDIEVLIHDTSFHPVKGGIQHIDFYAIERGKELTTNIPLEFVGEAPAIEQDGVLTKALHEVEVTCRPSVLPSHIDVDVSVLVDFDTVIRVSDLSVAEGVTITNDPEETVALVSAVEEEPEEPVEEVDMSEIEVEGKGKEEGSEEAGGAKEEAEK